MESLQSQIKLMKESFHHLKLNLEKVHENDQMITADLVHFQQSLVKKDDILKQCLQQLCTPDTNNNNSLTHVLDKLQQQQQYLATSSKEQNKVVIDINWTTPPRILLVDDDSVYRDICGRMLTIMKCIVDYAKDGLDALNKLNVNKYDLILMASKLDYI